MISGNRKLLEDVLYRVRKLELPQARVAPEETPRARLGPERSVGPLGGRPVERVGGRSRLQRSGGDRRGRRGALRPPRRGARSSSSTTARPTRRRARARRPARVVVRHPYNKGNGAAVKSGIRRASGEFVLIIDGDGQHRPEDARRLVSRLGEYDLVIGARAVDDAGDGARGAPATRCSTGSPATSPAGDIPDLTSGFRGARRECLREFLHLLPNGFSTPTTTTLAFIKAGYNVAFEPIDARQRVGASKIRLARDGAKFLIIILKIVTLFSPLRVFLPVSIASFAIGLGYAMWTDRDSAAHHRTRRSC